MPANASVRVAVACTAPALLGMATIYIWGAHNTGWAARMAGTPTQGVQAAHVQLIDDNDLTHEVHTVEARNLLSGKNASAKANLQSTCQLTLLHNRSQ